MSSKRYSEEQIVKVLQGIEGGASMAGGARSYGIGKDSEKIKSPAVCYDTTRPLLSISALDKKTRMDAGLRLLGL